MIKHSQSWLPKFLINSSPLLSPIFYVWIISLPGAEVVAEGEAEGVVGEEGLAADVAEGGLGIEGDADGYGLEYVFGTDNKIEAEEGAGVALGFVALPGAVVGAAAYEYAESGIAKDKVTLYHEDAGGALAGAIGGAAGNIGLALEGEVLIEEEAEVEAATIGVATHAYGKGCSDLRAGGACCGEGEEECEE